MAKRTSGREASPPPDGVLFQEYMQAHPFWMMVACSLVNLTTWRQAKPAFRALVLRYEGPSDFAQAQPEDLQDDLRPLGLWRRRSESLVKLAKKWVEHGPPADAAEVKKYPGLGQYASDSWAIFMEGRTDVHPHDGKLNWYMERLHAGYSRADAGASPPLPPGSHGDASPGGSTDPDG